MPESLWATLNKGLVQHLKLRTVRTREVRSLNRLKFVISATGRTSDLVILAPYSSRQPVELVSMVACPLKVRKSKQLSPYRGRCGSWRVTDKHWLDPVAQSSDPRVTSR